MRFNKEEILNYKQKVLEDNAYLLNAIGENPGYQRLLRERSHYPADLLYAEAKGIMDAIARGEIKQEAIFPATQLAIASLEAIQLDKYEYINNELIRRK